MPFIIGLIVRAVPRLLTVGGRDDGAKDLEISSCATSSGCCDEGAADRGSR